MEGTPICMPMYYDYDCDDAYAAKDQFMFGGNLLVCPITKPLDKQINLASAKVWLPEGRWTDIFNGQIYQGGQWVQMHRDLDKIPVLAPAGAIVPMYANCETNDLSLDQPLELHVWRGNGSYEMYEDDGESNDYVNGKYAFTPFAVQENGDSLTFTIDKPWGDASVLPETRDFLICFQDVVGADVTVNGEKIESVGEDFCIPVVFSGEKVVVELTNVVASVNPSRKEMEVELLTRVQWNNTLKSKIFTEKNRKNYPQFLKKALSELDSLI